MTVAEPDAATTKPRLTPSGRLTSTRGSVKETACVPVAVADVVLSTEQLPPRDETMRLSVSGTVPLAGDVQEPGIVPCKEI